MVNVSKVIRVPPSNHQGGVGVFVADKLFISTKLCNALKIANFITCLYRTVLNVNYLFHTGSTRSYIFQKNSSPPPPLDIEWWPPDENVDTFSRPKIYKITCICKSHNMHPFSTPSLSLQIIVCQGLCVKRGYLWSYQANNATLKTVRL